MFWMWNVGDVKCLGCWMLGMWDVWYVGWCGCWKFGMWNVGIRAVRNLGWETLVYKIPYYLFYCSNGTPNCFLFLYYFLRNIYCNSPLLILVIATILFWSVLNCSCKRFFLFVWFFSLQYCLYILFLILMHFLIALDVQALSFRVNVLLDLVLICVCLSRWSVAIWRKESMK